MKGLLVLGIGGTELVIILVFGFLIFGPDRLPAMGRTIGRALRQFQQAQDQMNKMVKTEIYDPINEAAKAPEKKQGPKKKTSAAAATKPETFAEKKARLAAEAQAKAERARRAENGEEAAQPAQAVVVPEKPVGRSETFAEKKARLEAEKAAAAAKKEAGAAAQAAAANAQTAAGVRIRTASASKRTGASRAAKLYDIDALVADDTADASSTSENGKGDQADA